MNVPEEDMLLYDDEHLQALWLPGATDFVIVTFSDMTMRPDGKTFWGRNAFEKLKVSAIGLVAKDRNWFPSQSMSKAIERIRPQLIQYKKRITYGFSMGAYASLRYSSQMSADSTLSFSPQFTIDQRKLIHLSPWADYYSERTHGDMDINPGHLSRGNHFIFYDPSDAVDNEQANNVKGLNQNVVLIPLRYAGHETSRLFASSIIVDKLISFALQNDVAGLVSYAVRISRENMTNKSKIRKIRGIAATCLKSRSLYHSERLLEVIGKLDESARAEVLLVSAKLYEKVGRREEAANAAKSAVQQARFDPHTLHDASAILMRNGLAGEAIGWSFESYVRSGGNLHAKLLLQAVLRANGYEWAANTL